MRIGQVGADGLVALHAGPDRFLATVPDGVVIEDVCFEIAVGNADVLRLRLLWVIEDVPLDPVAAHHGSVRQDGLLRRDGHAAHLLPLGILDQPVVVLQHLRLAIFEKTPVRIVVPALERNLVRRAEPLGIRVGAGVFREDVVVDVVFAGVVQVHRADLAALDDVAVDIEPAAGLVQVDAPGEDEELAVVIEADAVGAVIVADRGPAAGPAAAVGAAGILHFQVAVANAVVFQRVQHAAIEDAAAGHVVNQVVRQDHAATAEHQADPVPVELADVVDVAVVHDVIALVHFDLVAGIHLHAVPAEVPEVAAANRAVVAAADRDARPGEIAQIVDERLFDDDPFAVRQLNRPSLRTGEFQSANDDVRCVREAQDGVDGRNGNHRSLQRLRRQEVELLPFDVLVPFARRIEFFLHAEHGVTVFRPGGVRHLPCQRDGARRRIELPDLLDAVPPVVAGEDAHLAVGRTRPAASVLGSHDDRIGPFAFDVGVHRKSLAVDVRPTAGIRKRRIVVRIAGPDLPRPVEIDLPKLAVDAQRLQVGFEDLLLRRTNSPCC